MFTQYENIPKYVIDLISKILKRKERNNMWGALLEINIRI